MNTNNDFPQDNEHLAPNNDEQTHNNNQEDIIHSGEEQSLHNNLDSNARIEESSNNPHQDLNNSNPDDQNLDQNQNQEENIQEIQNNQEENEEVEQENSTESAISSLVSSVNNAHLMSEDNIEAIREVLCKKENVFYKLSPRDKNLEEELLTIIKWKAKIAEATIGQALNYYHQKLLDSELNHLDKLMRILKSNRREMYLRRLTPDYFDTNESAKTQQDSLSNSNETNPSEKNKEYTSPPTKTVSLRDLLPEYDPQRRYIRFRLNDKYEVYLKAFEEKQKRKSSFIDRIPLDVLQNHIFIYFNSFDLFKLRAVCSEWRELIRGMWHIIFRREMMEQVIAADLCNDIEMNFKLMNVKSPFYQKFGIFMKAITEIIDWNTFLPQLNTDTVDTKIKMLVITFFRMIGMYVGIDKLSDYQEVYWTHFKDIASNHLKTFIDSLFHHEFQFKSNYELDIIKENFLDCPDISSFSIRQLEDKNAIMLQLFLRQLLVFAQLKNYISLAQNYIILAKDKLKEVSKEWPHKKDFLEGAYKILLFKFIEIKDGEVIIMKEDNERRSGLLRNIQDELDECMNITSRIQNETPIQNKPDNATIVLPNNNPNSENTNENQSNNENLEQEVQEEKEEELTLGSILDKEFSQAIQNSQIKLTEGQIEKAEEKKESNNNEEITPDSNKDKLEKNAHPHNIDFVKTECDLNIQLAKIIQMKANSSSDITFEKFTQSKDPDYIINKNGAETRLYLDDLIKIEFLLQKILKQHLLHQNNECECPLHESKEDDDTENNNNNSEEPSTTINDEVKEVSKEDNSIL